MAATPQLTRVAAERAKTTKIFVEQYYEALAVNYDERVTRRNDLENDMTKLHLTDEEQVALRDELNAREREFTRMRRRKLTEDDFETLKVIGRGAFGEVKLVKMKDTNEIFAVKKLRKSEMLKKDQIAHVRAERDVLAAARNPWVVTLYYSFQDNEHLFLVMEFVPGGDMMNLLIKYDTFPEDVTRFYIAETILAIQSVHEMGYIHRDIKPDNLLLDRNGHLKLSDFGLCTGLHASHASDFYKNFASAQSTDVVLDTAPPTREEKNMTWKRKRREKAYSMVGTSDYIAPEVFLQSGYGKECDWWSVGVIMFEMLCGYPAFTAETAAETYQKILHWKEVLQFPSDIEVSPEAQDLIRRLCCNSENRLGLHGAEEIKNHAFFEGVDWSQIIYARAPFIPSLSSMTDVSCFENCVPDSESSDYGSVEAAKAVEVSSDLPNPFVGYTFKRFDGAKRRPSFMQ